jgi:hypothetical protein
MMDGERTKLEGRSNFLRLELKAWEKNFAIAHNGRKASREDIKKNPDIGISLNSSYASTNADE